MIEQVVFQLPLSGSHRLTEEEDSDKHENFQLPLSGSRSTQRSTSSSRITLLSTPSLGITGITRGRWIGQSLPVSLSTPSLGITDEKFWQVVQSGEDFQLPLSGSQGLDYLFRHFAWGVVAFQLPLSGSLNVSDRRVSVEPDDAFNSLSRDHGPRLCVTRK